jgi:hypothetical protein
VSASRQAFDAFRGQFPPRPPDSALIRNEDEKREMTTSDGLKLLQDGPVGADAGSPSAPPRLTPAHKADAYLWAVRPSDVCHAYENCAFGRSLETGVIKHTNLTGGGAASSGGELLFLKNDTIVVNGCSGRYGPRSKDEMDKVVVAFRQSGYRVWSMGYDDEANRGFPFVGVTPQWVP